MTPAPLNECSVEAPIRPSYERQLQAPSPRILRAALLVAIFTALVMLMQNFAGSFTTELSGYPDEPAHLITGLMIRDYTVSGLKTPPLQFARAYYLHYPKVGFGIWPPLFHFVEAAWFLLLPPSKISAFALQAITMGLLATFLATLTARFYGLLPGMAAALIFLTLPTTHAFAEMIMADGLMALFAFLSMVSFAVWLESRRLRDAILFGACIGLALMSKSNAAALALMPVLGLLLMRQYRRILSSQMIVAGLVALAIALPWQLLMVKLWTSTVSPTPYSPAIALHQLKLHFEFYFHACGVVICLLAVIGWVNNAVLPYVRGTIEPIWAAATALPLSLFLFAFAPLPPEPRYHIASYAVMCLFAAAGFSWLSNKLAAVWKTALIRPALGAALVASYAFTMLSFPHRAAYGYPDVAHDLLSDPKYSRAVILVSSENFGEGMLIAEIALDEPRPTHYVLRATKVLAKSRWDLDSYQLLWKTPAEIMSYLESVPIRLLVVDNTHGPVQMPHHQLLKQVIATYADKWSHVRTYPSSGANSAGGTIDVYAYTGSAVDTSTPRIATPITPDAVLR